MKTSTRVAALLGTAALTAGTATVALAGPASADVDRNGSCGGATYEFSVDRDDDRRNSYEVTADLDNAGGTKYRVVLKQNGKTFYNVARTADREGDIEVERNRSNTRGADTFLLQYRNTTTDQVCRTTIRVA
ncbi:hypothetical protein GCM10009737_33980 [Nocardioides lentus]|uniref:Secreted protein n=1 Tax=Nocardioides lentus TaxID=338077 RepID=A0ABP5B3D4_9ACTN